MGTIEEVVTGAREVETLLVELYGAGGRGLHAKITSVEGDLPPQLVRRLRKVATLRNRTLHEAGFFPDLAGGYSGLCAAAGAELRRVAEEKARRQPVPERRDRPFAWIAALFALFFFLAALFGLFFRG